MYIEEQYLSLLKDILENGVRKENRTGVDTLSVFGVQIRHKMEDGFPLLTTRKIHFKSIATELMWFLKGRTDLRYLLENGCRIWTGDAYKVYEQTHMWELDNDYVDVEEFERLVLEDNDFSSLWGNLGFIYGKQWRDFNGVDQISDLINNIKENPDSRRLIVNAWNASDLIYMKLPPCHYGFQIYTQERNNKRYISLMWNQRSVDTPLGLPFNIASYALLLKIIAKEVNMIPDELIGNLGDTHIYENQIEGIKKQISRTPNKEPELVMKDEFWNLCDENIPIEDKIKKYKPEMFTIEDYISHPAIKMPLSN